MSLIEKIVTLKKNQNALIIAHYYQVPAIQDIADYVGDSLGMALYAQQRAEKILLVCGVKFMAETIKVMNPTKTVLLPDLDAGCSLADSCTAKTFSFFKNKHPEAITVTYVNSSLEVKALSDVIVTSANAEKIISRLPKDKPILFAPDQHLGRHISKKIGRDLILFPGSCIVHVGFSLQKLHELKTLNPQAAIIAHPECDESILSQAHFIGSTSQLLEFTKTSEHSTYIVMTETGILHPMQKASPHKTFILGPDLGGCACNDCPHMKLNTLEKIYSTLNNSTPQIEVDNELSRLALAPLTRMQELMSQ